MVDIRPTFRRVLVVLVAGATLSSLLLVGGSSAPRRASSSEVLGERAALPPDREMQAVLDLPPPTPTAAPPPAVEAAQEPPAPTVTPVEEPSAAGAQAPSQPEPLPSGPVSPEVGAPQAAPTPAPPVAQAPTPVQPTVAAGENGAFASRVVDLINAARRQAGLEPLAPTPSLSGAAQREARALAEAGVVSHTAPDGTTMEGRVQAAGYGSWSALGEVIGAGFASPEDVVAQWLASPQHRAELLNPVFRQMGVGYYYLSGSDYGHWWVVDLAAP
jgi:uncharacterized protein YkwD